MSYSQEYQPGGAIQGLEGAMQLLNQSMRRNPRINQRTAIQNPVSNNESNHNNQRQIHDNSQMQANNNSQSYSVFRNQSNDIDISQRVINASQSHKIMLQTLIKQNQKPKANLNTGFNNQSNILAHNNVSNTQQKINSIQQANTFNIFKKKPELNTQNCNPFPQVHIAGGNIFIKSEINITAQQEKQQIIIGKKVQNQKQSQSKFNVVNKEMKEEIKQSIQQSGPKLNIFREGLFQEDLHSKKPKPNLVFNNNIISQQSNSKVQEVQQTSKTHKSGVKLLFNNNGAVVDNIKPAFNIFGGGLPAQQKIQYPKMQIEQKKQHSQVENQITNKNSLFNIPKMQIQKTQKPVQSSIFGKVQQSQQKKSLLQNNSISIFPKLNTNIQNVSSQSVALQKEKSNIFQVSQQPVNIFSNQQQLSKQKTFSNQQNTPLFSKPLNDSKSNDIKNSQISLFLNAQTPKPQHLKSKDNQLSSNLPIVQEQKSETDSSSPMKGGLFGSNPQNTGLFSNNSGLIQRGQTLNSTGGLFGNSGPNRNNIFVTQNQEQKRVQLPFMSQTSKLPVQTQTSKQVNFFSRRQQSSQISTIENKVKTNMFGGKIQQKTQNKVVQKAANKVAPVHQQPPKFSNNNPFAQSGISQPNMFNNNGSQNNIFRIPVGTSQNIFGTSGVSSQNMFAKSKAPNQNIFASNSQTSQGNNQADDDDQGQDGLEDDNQPLQHKQAEIKKQMKFSNYLDTTVYCKLEATKFKVVRTQKLVQKAVVSLQKFPDNDPTIYIIVRNPNKTVAYYGILIDKSIIKVNSKPDSDSVYISIQDLIQIDVLNQNAKSREMWRLLFKDVKQGNNFIAECEKIINNLKTQNKQN